MNHREQDYRQVAPFDSIDSYVPFPVLVTIRAEQEESVRITVSPSYSQLFPRLLTTVDNHTLRLTYNSPNQGSSFSYSSCNYNESVSIINGVVYRNGQRVEGQGPQFGDGGNPDFEITVNAHHVQALKLEGTGRLGVEGDSEVAGPELHVSLGGTGQIGVERLNVDAAWVDIGGTGQVFLAGRTNDLDVNLQGTGSFDGANLASRRANVDLSGTGGAKVRVSEELSGSISGVGSIGYIGEPALNVQKSFIGRLFRIG